MLSDCLVMGNPAISTRHANQYIATFLPYDTEWTLSVDNLAKAKDTLLTGKAPKKSLTGVQLSRWFPLMNFLNV
jgi:hypothetical protein